ncbi:MAG: MerR family transcriptional regulator [Pseudomonadota bacterium]
MRISELAARAGVSTHALRHYERQGLLCPARRPSGYREYPASALRDVQFIVQGRRLGFSLKELGEALPAYRAGRLTPQFGIEALTERIATLDRELAARRALRAELLRHLKRLQRQLKENER